MKQTVIIPASTTQTTVEVETIITVTSTPPPPGNLPPVVNAGSDVTITLPVNSVTLNGSGSDPDGTVQSFLWTKVSGVGGNISNPSNAITTVTGLTEGTYVFKLTVTDNSAASTSDNATVVVNPAIIIPPPNPGTEPPIEGGGANATGGSNSSDVRLVSNQSQFVAAIGSNRTIRFTANVTITGGAARWVLANISYLTIDGNGFNVTFDNGNNGVGISFDGANTHHIIMKGIRVINAGDDGIQILDGAHDIAIVNCSSYLNRDGNLDITTGAYNITAQYNFLGKGNSGWSGDMLIAYDNTRNISVHHNLFSPATKDEVGERCPLVSHGSSVVADFRNNVLWKWGRSNGSGSGFACGVSDSAKANFINNYFYSGSSNNWNSCTVNRADPNLPAGQCYAAGNFSGNSGVNANAGSNVSSPFAAPAMNTETAFEAAKKVVALAGVKNKDAYELGVFNDAKSLPGVPQ